MKHAKAQNDTNADSRLTPLVPPMTDAPSSRPTSIPDAFEVAGLEMPRPSTVPPDLAIPVRVIGADVDGVGVRAAFVFMHVDGSATIAEIARYSQLPLRDAFAAIEVLVAVGAVALRGTPSSLPPRSGVFSEVVARDPEESGTVRRIPLDEVVGLADQGSLHAAATRR